MRSAVYLNEYHWFTFCDQQLPATCAQTILYLMLNRTNT